MADNNARILTDCTLLELERSPLSSPELLNRYPLILSTGGRNLCCMDS